MTAAVPVHPSKVVPVTKYVVVAVGLRVTVCSVPRVVVQFILVPVISDLAVSSELSPRQISDGVAVVVIVGKG